MDNPAPKKQLGQHWLHDEASLAAMVAAAHVQATDYVVEVGPGLGTLTQYLLNTGAHVHAIEFDDTLAASITLRISAAAGQFELTHGDIMQFDFTHLPAGYKVVANIPYYLTSGLLRILSESNNPPHTAVLLVQKEVAERVYAQPGDTSVLSITAQMYFTVSLGKLVPAELFTPPPKVDSQILILEHRQEPYFGSRDSKQLFRIVKAGFSERRKKLRSSLSGGLGISKDAADVLLAKAAISSDLRAQNLSLDDWLALYDAAYSH